MDLILPRPGAEKGDHAPCSPRGHRKGLSAVSIPCADLVSNPGRSTLPRKGPLEPQVGRQTPRRERRKLLTALCFKLCSFMGRQIPEWRVIGANKEAGVSGQPWGSWTEGKEGAGGPQQGAGPSPPALRRTTLGPDACFLLSSGGGGQVALWWAPSAAVLLSKSGFGAGAPAHSPRRCHHPGPLDVELGVGDWRGGQRALQLPVPRPRVPTLPRQPRGGGWQG